MNWMSRTIQPSVLKAAGEVPVVALFGPRGAGKTELLRHLFASSHRYCPLDDPRIRQIAREDPRLLFDQYPPPVVLDEFQFVPELIPFLRERIDAESSPPGRYVLAASQLQPIGHRLAEGLGARTQTLTLLSLSLQELAGQPAGNRSWREVLLPTTADQPPSSFPGPLPVARRILRGGFALAAIDDASERVGPGDPMAWHSTYVQEFLERETHFLRSPQDRGAFERFLFALATRTGRLLNLEELARDIGITGKTARAWIEVLEAAGQILVVHPLEASVGRRLVKRPRVYFLDTGILAFLLNVSQPDQVLSGIAAIPLFKTAVAAELARLLAHRGHSPQLYFWETAAGHRVDFVIGDGQQLIPIDTVLSSTPTPADARQIEALQQILGDHVTRGLLVCLTRRKTVMRPTVDAVPLGAL